jgi:AcrR family transcriptional regulator
MKALVLEQPYESITVLDLAARAEVNRTTFYQHFRDKDALLDSIIDDLLGALMAESDAYFNTGQVWLADQAPPFLVALFERVGQEGAFYRRMLGPGGSSLFIGRMVHSLEQAITQRAALTPSPPWPLSLPREVPPLLTARFLALGLIGSLTWWLEHGEATNPRQAAAWSWRLSTRLSEPAPTGP